MKKLLKSVALFAGALSMVACMTKETITPSFPEQTVTDSNVTAAKTVTFDANQDWEVSVPQSTIAYFWIEGNGGNKLNKLSGKAGKITIKIGVTDQPDFEKDIVCDVTLKMGGESKVIATYTLKKIEKVLKVYTCKVDEDGLVYKAEGGYDFNADSTNTVSLVYQDPYGFVMPISIASAFNYDVESTDWIEFDANPGVVMGKRDTVDVRVGVDFSKVNADNINDGVIRFYPRNTEELVTEVKVELPDLEDVVISDLYEASFNAAGSYVKNEVEFDSCAFSISYGGDKVLVMAGIGDDGYWSASGSDCPYMGGAFTVEGTEGYFKTQNITVTMNEYTGTTARQAYLLLIPRSKLYFVSGEEDEKFYPWITQNSGKGDDLHEDFEEYVIFSITQEGVPAPEAPKSLLNIAGDEVTVEPMTIYNPFYEGLKGMGIDSLYVIKSNGAFTVSSDTPIVNATMMNENGEPTTDLFSIEAGESFKFSATKNTKGIVIFETMDEENSTPDEFKTKPFAAAWVEYTAAAAADLISFAYPDYVNGAKLEKYEGMSPIYATGVPHYKLTYTSANPMMAMLNVPGPVLWGGAYYNETASNEWWVIHEPMNEDQTQISIFMNTPTTGQQDYFLFGSGIMSLDCVLIFEYVPAE